MKKLLQLRLSFLRRNIAANAASPESVTICAANARAFTGDEWEQITPWGDFPNRQGLQRLNKTTGQRMVDAFNSLVGKAKNAISPVPIYSGHPDVDPENYKDDRRYGKIEALEARDDGLWCKPAYNDLGKQNKEQGYWVFPSGVWKFKRCAGGVIEPFELLSVGLTNKPVIKEVQPWTRNSEERAGNGNTREGALKGWATRRANGEKGASNKVAVKVKAMTVARKTGRKPDEAAAAKSLEKKASGKKSARDISNDAAKKINAHLKGVSTKKVTGSSIHSDIAATAAGHGISHQKAADRFVAAAKQTREEASAVKKTLPPPLPAKSVAKPPPLPQYESVKLRGGPQNGIAQGVHPNVKSIVHEDTRDGSRAQYVRTSEKDAKGRTIFDHRAATPPPLPKSSSSGAGNHVHIHLGESGSTRTSAPVDHDPYFGYAGNSKTFSGKSRLKALRLRKKQTAAA